MKKITKIAFATLFAAITGYGVCVNLKPDAISNLTLANVEALASNESSMCENGCVSNGSGCLCHYWYPTYKEYNW